MFLDSRSIFVFLRRSTSFGYHTPVKVPVQPTNPLYICLTALHLTLYVVLAFLLFTLAAYHLPTQLSLKLFSYIAQSQTPDSPSPLSNPPFLGINVALEQYDLVDRQDTLARLRARGFGWVRQRLDWGKLEPTPGDYVWHSSDALLHEIRAADLIPVIVLDGSPAWARAPQDQPPTDNPFAPPEDMMTFARFAAAFAERYQRQLTYYQLWDEPNIAPHWGNRLIEPVGYAQLLRVTSQAIRNVDPNAVILSAALAPTRDRGHTAIDEIYYLQRLYAAGTAPYFDVLAIQPFGFGYTPTDAQIEVERLNFARAVLIRQTMVAAGDSATPIWAVRYGWNRQLASPWATVTEADQLQFAIDALRITKREWSWLTAMAWVIDQPVLSTTDPNWGFALSEPLATAFQEWQVGDDPPTIQGPQRRDRDAAGAANDHQLWPLFGYLLGLAVTGWRTLAVGQQLPWIHWERGYGQWSWWIRVGLWIGLGVVYYFALWPPLILSCWLAAIILLRWQPQAGLWLVAVLVPFYAQHKEFELGVIAVAVAPSHALLLCCLVAMGWRNGRSFRGRFASMLAPSISEDPPAKHQGNTISKLSLGRLSGISLTHLALFWLLINLLSARNVWHWPAYGKGLWDLVLMPLLGLWLLRRLVLTRQETNRLLLALCGGGFAVAMIGLAAWLRGDGTAVDGLLRLVGPYFSPNQAALYLGRTFFLGLGLALSTPRCRRWLLGLLGLILAALVLTASRGALLLGLPAGLLAWGWQRWGWRRWRFTTDHNNFFPLRQQALTRSRLLLAGIIVCVIIGLILYGLMGERLTNSATVGHRLTIWQSSFALWHDYLGLGVGAGGFFWHYPAYLPLGALDEPNLYHPHNLWLEMATGWGLLGLLWMGLLLWWLIQRARHCSQHKQQCSWTETGLLCALVAGLVHAQVDAFWVLPDLALWNWFALGLLANYSWSPQSSCSHFDQCHGHRDDRLRLRR